MGPSFVYLFVRLICRRKRRGGQHEIQSTRHDFPKRLRIQLYASMAGLRAGRKTISYSDCCNAAHAKDITPCRGQHPIIPYELR